MITSPMEFNVMTVLADQSRTLYNEGSRSVYAITAEVGDYSRRLVEDGTSTLNQVAHASTVEDAFGVLNAFGKRTSEEYAQHMHRLASMMAEAARLQTLALQSLMSGHRLAA